MKPLPVPGWVSCPGQAHDEVWHDGCSICAPHWYDIPVCPQCKTEDGCVIPNMPLAKMRNGNLRCPRCRRQYQKERKT